MIRRSRKVLVCCAGAALALHGAGLWVSGTPARIEVAGGAGAVEATLGSSFADMAAGVAQPASEVNVTPNRQAEEVARPAPPRAALRSEPPRAAAPAPVAQAEVPLPEVDAPAALAVTADPVPAASPPAAASARPPALRPAATPRETVARSAAAPQEGIAPQTEAEGGVQVSRRPQARPPALEEAAARQSPEPERRETRSRSRSQQGNNAPRDARAGSAAGQESAAAAQQGRESARQSVAQGNAAASTYPGEVMRHLARVPRPRADSRGAALVRFSIGAGGRLASLGLARSSGSARLDRAALTVVQRAEPFPAPPSGAQTSFSILIEGR
jgi:protein TonB